MRRRVLISWIAVNNDPYERDRAGSAFRLVDGAPVPGPTLTLLFDPDSPYAGSISDFVLSIEAPNAPLPQIVSGGETTFHHQLRHVLDVIAGRARPITGGEDALNNMRAIDAIYRAAGLKPRGLPA